MATNPKQPVNSIGDRPTALRREGAISIEVEEGIVVLRASKAVVDRVESLLRKSRGAKLTSAEKKELKQFEEIDDYLSLLNRLSRNLAMSRHAGETPSAP